ncbi:MAG: radical SAM protein [Planctomycetes bacterium]|nr:radical SAM protein [Planctomycetota bacterium]
MTEPKPTPTPSSSASASTRTSSGNSASAAEQKPLDGKSVEQVHDFARKLQQPSLWSKVVDYVEWQRAQRAAKAAGKPAPDLPDLAPLSINLDLTTACNYACDHCIDWDILNSKVRHEDQELRDSLQRMAERGLKSVILIGGGEPTLYPGFAGIVEFLKQLGLSVAVVSNGSRGDRLLAAAPFFTEGDWIRLSLDSGSNEVFRRMHNPSSKTLTLDEICSWMPKIKAANPAVQLGFSFVITWKGGSRGDVKIIENIQEMVMASKRASDAMFDYISFKPFLERQQDGAEVMDPAKTEAELQAVVARIQTNLAEARNVVRPGFRVLASTNLRVLMAGNWRDYTKQPRVCHMQMLRQVVTPLGSFNCPAHRGVEKAKLGGKELWQVPAAAQHATAKLLADFDASHECREVTCLYNSTNWWLEEMIEAGKPLPKDAPAPEARDWFL